MQNEKTFPTLHSERCLLRQIIASDQENIFKGLSHPDVIKHYGVSFETLQGTEVQMKWYATHQKEETGLFWAVCDKTTGTFMGVGGFNDWSQEHRRAEIGFWLMPEYWGKGIMKETMQLMIQHAFEVMKIHRIEGYVDSKNVKCKSAIQKLNFEHEGCMRDYEIKDGDFVSFDIFALLSPS